MPNSVVVDASVIAKWFIAEPESDAAQNLLLSDDVLVAPAHALAEVGEVLVKAVRRGLVSERQLREAVLALPSSFVSVSLDEIFAQAVSIAREIDASVYDALYIAAAERWDCQLVTADQRLLMKAAPSRYAGMMRRI